MSFLDIFHRNKSELDMALEKIEAGISELLQSLNQGGGGRPFNGPSEELARLGRGAINIWTHIIEKSDDLLEKENQGKPHNIIITNLKTVVNRLVKVKLATEGSIHDWTPVKHMQKRLLVEANNALKVALEHHKAYERDLERLRKDS